MVTVNIDKEGHAIFSNVTEIQIERIKKYNVTYTTMATAEGTDIFFTAMVKNKPVWFDIDDLELFLSYGNLFWSKGYLQGFGKMKSFHRAIIKKSYGITTNKHLHCDHISRKKHDNRKSNLRVIPSRANFTNKPRPKSGYYHVIQRNENRNKYRPRFEYKKEHYFGTYDDPVIAAIVADSITHFLMPDQYIRDSYNFPDDIKKPEETALSEENLTKLYELKARIDNDK